MNNMGRMASRERRGKGRTGRSVKKEAEFEFLKKLDELERSFEEGNITTSKKCMLIEQIIGQYNLINMDVFL
ncbi:hypothetical protein P4646_02080 [Peribacillus simplex]|uniref:hypothetical protein n=1 Tax=Peribacillus simplex TaxID=1478 RepID=UPI0011DE1098|nr:hypothetical protein [Peribacillus simplex]MED3982879.1 hypothetical protein [Peribacillus simplex]MED4095578.1 hypothetical protein [Peribacillus simplex]CAH0250673.1 hypothetical protein SRABI84_03116 [Peribacillus simplex]